MDSIGNFQQRRSDAKAKTAKAIEAAYTADRQARDRCRKALQQRGDYRDASEDDKKEMLEQYIERIMTERIRKGQDVDTKRTNALDLESEELNKIDEEEVAMKQKYFTALPNHKRKINDVDKNEEDDDDDEEDALIKDAFTKRMKPLIQRWERIIVAAGQELEPDISEAEISTFAKSASNPADIKKYLADPETYLDGLEDEDEEIGDDDDDNLEVVLTDDEEDDDTREEDEDDEFGFINNAEIEIPEDEDEKENSQEDDEEQEEEHEK